MWVCLSYIRTFVFGSLMIVAGVMLSDKALTPIPPTPAIDSSEARDLRVWVENGTLRAENERLARESLRLAVELDMLRRSAILFPMRSPDESADLIPTQNVPAAPVPTRTIPEAHP